MRRRTVLIALAVLAGLAGLILWLRSGRAGGGRSPASTTTAARTGPGTSDLPDTAAIPAMLRDTSWRVRLPAVYALRELPTVPLKRRVELLLAALDHEVMAPDSGPTVRGSYAPLTSFLRMQYVGLLEEWGPPAAEFVRQAPPPATAEAKAWRAIALASTGAQDAAPPLRLLVSSSRDFVARMAAAHFLGDLRDREAIPVLTKALADTATARASRHDLPSPDDRRFFPVREAAAGALEEMGVAVERRGDSYTVQ